MNNHQPNPSRAGRLSLTGITLCLLTVLFWSAMPHEARAQASYSLSNVWNVAAGAGNLTTDNGNRGIAYSVLSNQVFVGYRAAATTGSIAVYDGTAGTVLTNLVTGSSLGIDQVGVGDDGVLYGVPLQTAISGTAAFTVYSWTNWSTSPHVAYSSTNTTTDPGQAVTTKLSGKRVGDSMAVTGSGTNTLILAAANGLNSWVLLSTTDGVNFTSTVLTNSGSLPTPGGGVQIGLAFYTNNTFLLKPESSTSPNLYLIQFPTNFASLSSPVSCTVLATNTVAASSGSGYPAISYSPAGGILALETNYTTTASPVGLFLYSITNYASNALQLAQTTLATTVANGNLTEAIALGGTGKTNWLYAMDCNNGLHGYQITYTVGPVAPVITGPTGYSGAYPPQTLTVSETGTAPITNLWYSNTSSNTTGGTLLQSSTNTSYTVTTAATNYYYVVATNAAGAQTSSVVLVSLIPPTTNSVVSPLFSIAPGTYPFEANDDFTRGIGYDTNTGILVVANRTGGSTPNIFLLNGTTGASNGAMNMTGMYVGGTFAIDQVGVADDGAVYAGNLAIAGQQFNLTRWPAPTTNAVLYNSFNGDAGNDGLLDRWGDSMAVRGAGVNTQILLSSRSPSTNIALLTTSDGSNFTAVTFHVSGVPGGFAGNGVAFGAGNTLWGKSYLGDLYQVSFDPNQVTNPAVLLDYVAASQIPSHMVGVGVDAANSILGGVVLSDQNPDLQLFQLTGNANPPVLFDQAFFPAYNPSANGNDLGVVVMKYPRCYAMDVDLGIIGVTYGVPASTPPTITPPATNAITIFASSDPYPLTFSVSGTLPLYYQWQTNSSSNLATAVNISGATSGTYSVNTTTTNATAWYDVVVTNFGGAATSAPVLLTVLEPVTSTYVTNVWRLAAGGSNSAILDTGNYNVRGLAYDTNTATVLLCNHAGTGTITVLNAANGSASSIAINTAGLQPGTFYLDQIGVADDGVLYGGNLAITSLGDTFSLTSWSSVSSGASLNQAYGPADPGAGSGERWGDTMAIRGAGTNTQILLGSYGQGDGPGTNVVLLTTTDGETFNATLIGVPGVPSGFAGLGIAFGAGNTFWAKGGHNYDLRQISFDPANVIPAAVIQDYSAGVQTPNDLTGLGVDAANNILIGTCFNDTPNDLQFYQLTGTTNSPVLFDQAFYASENANYQENAASVIKFPWAFGLNVNNGLVAVQYAVPPAVLAPFSVTASHVGATVVLSWPSVVGHNYHVLSSAVATTARSTWSTNATDAGTGSTLFYTNSAPSGTLFYTIQGQ